MSVKDEILPEPPVHKTVEPSAQREHKAIVSANRTFVQFPGTTRDSVCDGGEEPEAVSEAATIDDEACSLYKLDQLASAIAAKVAYVAIDFREQDRKCRHIDQESPTGLGHVQQSCKRGGIVLYVFEDVERVYDAERLTPNFFDRPNPAETLSLKTSAQLDVGLHALDFMAALPCDSGKGARPRTEIQDAHAAVGTRRFGHELRQEGVVADGAFHRLEGVHPGISPALVGL